MGSLGWALIQHDWSLYKRRLGLRGTSEDKGRRWLCTNQGEMPWEEPALGTPGAWTVSLQDYERINYCLSLLVCSTCFSSRSGCNRPFNSKVFSSRTHQFSSVTQSCPTLCVPMNRSTPGLPVHHQLPEFTETHVHRVSDAIQPSHPLSSPSPPALNPSQHQSLFQ